MKLNFMLVLATAMLCWSASNVASPGRPPHGPPPWVEDPSDDTEIILRVEALEEISVYLQQDLGIFLAALLPEGAIMAFAGPGDSIPEGWALCDGNNDTPDLVDRFIVGASGENDAGQAGGTTEHDHGNLDHDHSLQVPGHNHEIPAWEGETYMAGDHKHSVGNAEGDSVRVDIDMGGTTMDYSPAGHTHGMLTINGLLEQTGDHKHELQVPTRTTGPAEEVSRTTSEAPASQTAKHIPPFYKLAFIMKLRGEEITADVTPAASLALRLSELEEDFGLIDDSLEAALPNHTPTGLIVAWSGSFEDLPGGWLLCNGEEGTPDLTDRYIMGASIEEEIATVGGSGEHTHFPGSHQHKVNLPPHRHTSPNWDGATIAVPDHTHNWVSVDSANLEVRLNSFSDYYAQGAHSHTFSAAGGHSHNLFIPEALTTVAEGSGFTEASTVRSTPVTSLPPFYKLAYIQKAAPVAPSGIDQFIEDAALALSSDPIDRIEDLELTASTLIAVFDAALPFLAPEHGIGLWADSLQTVPSGWAFCDGDTSIPDLPDLRSVFVMGTEDSIGSRGGQISHVHWLDAHSHKAVFPHEHWANATMLVETDTDTRLGTGHLHREWASWIYGADTTGIPTGNICSAMHQHGYWGLEFEQFHEHQVEITNHVTPQNDSLWSPTEESASYTSSASNLPPFTRLVYVMKTAAISE